VPLSSIQTEILHPLAANRDPESDVAGASPLNRDAPRIDVGVFHDREERVAAAALADTQTQPDPDRLDHYQTRAGQRRCQWPDSPEIHAAMFERYFEKPSA
jgi:hypothetical protein